MYIILFLLGGIGLLASLGLLIVNLVKKQPKKKSLISLGISFLVFAVSIGIAPDTIDDTTADMAEETEDVEVESELVEAEEESEPKEKPKEELEVEESNVNQEDLEKASLAIVRENFEGVATVEYDASSKSYNVLPVDQDLVNELIELVTGNENMLEGWEVLVEGMANLSASLKDNLGSGYVVNLLNPTNTENVLLICVDGVIFYNVADDL